MKENIQKINSVNRFSKIIKTKAVLFFAFYIVLNLVIPNQKVLADFSFSNTVTKNISYVSSEEILVKVISSPVNQNLEIKNYNSRIIATERCANLIVKSDINLIQQQNQVNLNEPANCYNLTVEQLMFAKNKLAVQPLIQGLKSVKVVINRSLIQEPIFSKSSNQEQTPIIPIATSFLVLSYFTVKFKNKVLDNHLKSKFEFNILSLDYLQVYRC